jgi:hydroxymethylbilane synthase
MRKLSEGLCDALVLAYAGVFRMNYAQYIVKNLSVDEFTPAVGQGSIAIEIAKKLDTDIATQIKLATNHTETEYRVRAERSFLKTLQGGCSIPTFALAQVQGSSMSIKGGLISLDGKTRIEATANGTIADAEKLGKEIAEKVLAEGGEAILADIRRVLEK